MKIIMIRMFLILPLAGLIFTGCAMGGDKNQPPVAVAPPVQAAPAPPPPPEPAYVPEPEPEKIVLDGVNFDFDKSTLKPRATAILDHAVNVMKQHPDRKFSIEGHTDSIGSDQYNEGLAQRRVDAVRNYLVQHGIASHRIDVSSYGERNPVASNETEEGRARNRRVEIDPTLLVSHSY